MFKAVTARTTRLCIVMLCSAVLGACGGGGGGAASAPSSPSDGRFAAVPAQPIASVQGVEGTPETADLNLALSYTGNAGLYLAVEGDAAVLFGVQGQASGGSLTLKATLRGDLSPGDYATDVLLHACLDLDCTHEPAGSPVSLPVRYQVRPNLQVQRFVVLGRTGVDAAPSALLPVSLPGEAGAVTMQASGYSPDAFAVSFDGSALQVQTRQVPEGVYLTAITLQSATDKRYSRTVEVQYTVSAPAAGEHALSVTNASRHVNLQQGTASVQHLQVNRPTWTNAWDAPVIYDPDHLLTLTDLGNDQYDVSIDTAGLPVGSYAPSIHFSAGPTGGTAVASFAVSVNASFYLDAWLDTHITASSTAADLALSGPVRMFDGSAVRWTAVSKSPWLQVTRSSGMTGVDALEVSVDPAALAQPDWTLTMPIELSVDQPGALPQTLAVVVHNDIPWLQEASPATLVGSSGRVYLQGVFPDFTDFANAAWFHVTGAKLDRVQVVGDARFLGTAAVLALDLSGAVPGTPVSIHIDNPFMPSQLQLQVQPPLQTAAAHQPLSRASYRPAQFAPGLAAAYFSGPDTVYRWSYSGGAWTLSQAASPGVIDVAPSRGDDTLYATAGTQVKALNPLTLAQQSTAVLASAVGVESFDSSSVPNMSALVFSADGRALGGILDVSVQPDHGVGWVCSMDSVLRGVQPLTSAPRFCDPGTANRSGPGALGWGLVRSANGHTVVGVGPQGQRSIYRASERAWLSTAALPDGMLISAVSDNSARVLRSDGMLIDNTDRQLGYLGSFVPFTHVAGGYGLSSDGRFGLVYSYRIVGVGSAQRATDATLWVVDLGNAAATGVGSAPLLASVALPSAVGCTAAPEAGETCQHLASITVAPGNGTAFVLGPRGIAAVPLPAAVVEASQGLSLTVPDARAAKLRSSTVRLPLHGSVTLH